MEKLSLPSKITFRPFLENPNRSQVIIEPCYPGYGITIGNAIRRVLLSSLPGAAVTAFKIKGVAHEFSSLPYVKEDVIEIILALKLLRVKLLGDEPQKLSLEVRGEREVKAGDIEVPSQVEIVNHDLHIATLTDPKAYLKMELWVEKGRGYVPVEDRENKKGEIGLIAIDSIFTPVRKVGLRIENVRVGKRTDWDRLILDIETDGIITVEEAIRKAATILIDHFSLLAKEEEKKVEKKKEKKKEEKSKKKKEIKKKVEKKVKEKVMVKKR